MFEGIVRSGRRRSQGYQSVFWIQINVDPDLVASLDPDRYWEYGFRIRIQDSQNEVQKVKKIRDFKLKRAYFFDG